MLPNIIKAHCATQSSVVGDLSVAFTQHEAWTRTTWLEIRINLAACSVRTLIQSVTQRSQKVVTTRLTPHLVFNGNETGWLREGWGSSQSHSCRQTQRGWKESRFPAGPGNHTVIYKLCLSPHLTWPSSFHCSNTTAASEETSSTLFYNLLQLDSWQMYHLCQVTTV